VVMPHYLVILCGESCFLISWWSGDRYDIAGSDSNRDRSSRPDAENRGWSNTGSVLSGQTIKRSDDTVCDLHRAQGNE
jgi:hypothetical protein